MNSQIQNNNSQQTLLALAFSFIIAIISTLIIYVIDMLCRIQGIDLFAKLRLIVLFWDEIEMKNQLFGPLTLFQFYAILFIVVFGLVVGLLFYREQKEEAVEEVSEFRTKMTKKKLKKAKKSKV
ncbi:MAG: hypothetical protein K8R25_17365 [Methanosarcinales archaeon]|nr:hypothetical protein [Methanosarcinales archaeon]